MLRALHADIRVSELYRPLPYLHSSATTARFDPTHLTAWADTTTGPLTTHLRPGGHFHRTENPTDMATDVTSHLTR